MAGKCEFDCILNQGTILFYVELRIYNAAIRTIYIQLVMQVALMLQVWFYFDSFENEISITLEFVPVLPK